MRYRGKKYRFVRLGIDAGRLEVLEARMRLPEATTQARAATERSRPEGEVHEALTASERAQSDEVHRRLEWLAMLDQAREQPHPVAAYHAGARSATMPGPASLKGVSRTVVSRARQEPRAPVTGHLPLWCSSYAGNAVTSVIAGPLFAKRPCASVRGAPGGRVVVGICFSLCNNSY